MSNLGEQVVALPLQQCYLYKTSLIVYLVKKKQQTKTAGIRNYLEYLQWGKNPNSNWDSLDSNVFTIYKLPQESW